MMEYVAGFFFDGSGENVVLIRKNKPEWQRGKLNGVGGKIEDGETPHEAMVREFKEETNVYIDKWNSYATLSGKGFTVHFFYAFDTEDLIEQVYTKTDEVVDVFSVCDISYDPTVIPNLHWLIPMAQSMRLETANGFEIREISSK